MHIAHHHHRLLKKGCVSNIKHSQSCCRKRDILHVSHNLNITTNRHQLQLNCHFAHTPQLTPHTTHACIRCRFAQKESHFNLNSGLFFISSNMRTIELMERLEKRLSREKYWDQTAYNEEMFFLSHGNYKSPKVGGF